MSDAGGTAAPKRCSNSPGCGVTMQLELGSRGSTSGTSADASRTRRTSISISDFTSFSSAPRSATASPIPIAAESSPTGSIPRSFEAEPLVSLASAIGTTIRSGDAALVADTLCFGTAVYTRSEPNLRAARDDSIGAPWYR